MSTPTKTLKKNLDDTREAALRTAGSAADVASDALSGARDALSESGERLSDTLRRAAERADPRAIQQGVSAAVSSGVAATADMLRDRSLSDIAADVRGSAQRHPGLFMLGAAVAGFALARLLAPAPGRRP
ncbi:MAG: hypothetical protein LPK12_17955 [Rhodobacterales bacterium]|nr:hypothetical protein [Rhodobacterales bacterium]MDX5501817.1 hypothetical protein [Rhodobacterales bacterium]